MEELLLLGSLMVGGFVAGSFLERLGLPRAAGYLPPTMRRVGARTAGRADDEPVIEMNRDVMRMLGAPVQLEIVPGATHLFEEPGALEQVAALAAGWCRTHLQGARA